jgi:hypothetical protein
MVGRRSPQSLSISRLTLQPETISSCYRRARHTEFQPHSGRHPYSVRPFLVFLNLLKGDAEMRRHIGLRHADSVSVHADTRVFWTNFSANTAFWIEGDSIQMRGCRVKE